MCSPLHHLIIIIITALLSVCYVVDVVRAATLTSSVVIMLPALLIPSLLAVVTHNCLNIFVFQSLAAGEHQDPPPRIKQHPSSHSTGQGLPPFRSPHVPYRPSFVTKIRAVGAAFEANIRTPTTPPPPTGRSSSTVPPRG